MLTLWCAAIIFMAQADDTSRSPVLPDEVVVRGDKPAIYGKVTEVPNGLQIDPDEPWDPKRRSVFVKSDDVISHSKEDARHHEKRYRENFEKLGLTLVGERYWVPQEWLPKTEVEFAKRAREMTKEVDARVAKLASAPAENAGNVSQTESASTPPAPAGDSAASQWGPMVFVGVIGLALAGLAAKFLL